MLLAPMPPAGVAQLAEHNVANVVVVGSNPITRSLLWFFALFIWLVFPAGKFLDREWHWVSARQILADWNEPTLAQFTSLAHATNLRYEEMVRSHS